MNRNPTKKSDSPKKPNRPLSDYLIPRNKLNGNDVNGGINLDPPKMNIKNTSSLMMCF